MKHPKEAGRGAFFPVILAIVAAAVFARQPQPYQNPGRWRTVQVWKGSFATRLDWSSSKSMLQTDVDNRSRGNIRWEKSGGSHWEASGKAIWQIDTTAITRFAALLSENRIYSSGETADFSSSLLEIDPAGGTYTFYLYPGGEEQDDFGLASETRSSSGKERVSGTWEELDPGTESSFQITAYRFPLSSYRLRLCGSIVTWSGEWLKEIWSWDLRPPGVENGSWGECHHQSAEGEAAAVAPSGDLLGQPGRALSSDPQEPPRPSTFFSEEPSRWYVFLVDLEGGAGGATRFGCGDSLIAIPVESPVPEPEAVNPSSTVRSLLETLFTTPSTPGRYNALARSSLRVVNVSRQDASLSVYLAGQLTLGGECDDPRVRAQLTQTVRQLPGVEQVSIFINGTPLDEILGGR